MRMVSLAAIFGAVVALLAASPLFDRESPASALLVDIICYGTSLIGPAAATEHSEHPAGLYMPMFSTPPAGGIIYNGPPLDEC